MRWTVKMISMGTFEVTDLCKFFNGKIGVLSGITGYFRDNGVRYDVKKIKPIDRFHFRVEYFQNGVHIYTAMMEAL